MATDRREQGAHLQRYRPPGVMPLEIWDFPIGSGILSDLVGSVSFDDALLRAITELSCGDRWTPSNTRPRTSYLDFDAVVLTGGGATSPRLDGVQSTAKFEVVCLGPDPFIGERGGCHLLSRAGLSGAVVDVGQTQIKISLAGHRFTYPRDFVALPVRSTEETFRSDTRTIELQRDRLERFIGSSLQHACRETGVISVALVIALPCEIDDDVMPGSSSYIGTDQNAGLVSRALHHSGVGVIRASVLNDAELAAVSVAVSPSGDLGKRILVVTIGFAVGAALLDSEVWKK